MNCDRDPPVELSYKLNPPQDMPEIGQSFYDVMAELHKMCLVKTDVDIAVQPKVSNHPQQSMQYGNTYTAASPGHTNFYH